MLEAWADEIVEISDESNRDTVLTESGEHPDNEWISRSKLRVDTRKWLLSKLMPKKYGDKIETQHSGGITVGWADSGQPKAIEPKS